MQEKFNMYRHFEHPERATAKVHSEIAALSKLPWYVYENGFNMQKATIYIFRENRSTHNYACSLPCPACMAAIRESNIGRIVATVENGITEIKL